MNDVFYLAHISKYSLILKALQDISIFRGPLDDVIHQNSCSSQDAYSSTKLFMYLRIPRLHFDYSNRQNDRRAFKLTK